MDLQLEGKRALVTGSSSGIGEGIAKALAREGVTVVVHGRREQAAARVAQEITVNGGKAVVALGDLSQDDDARRVAEQSLSTLGGIDILINNSGAFPAHGWMDATASQWVELYNTNVGSMVRLIQLLVPQMKELRWGRIIQIASTGAVNPGAGMPDYAATKAANITMTVSLSKELANTGITVNTISPGPIYTGGFDVLARELAKSNGWETTDIEEIKQRLLDVWKLPVGKFGTPEDVANLVTFVASPLAGFIDGANLRVDGGFAPTTN